MTRYVQIQNPVTKRWVKVDRKSGAVVKESPRRFAYIPVTSRDAQNYQEPRVGREPAKSGDPLSALRR